MWIEKKHCFFPCKFNSDLRFANQSLHVCGFVICGVAQVRNLGICDCAMSPRICGPTFAVQCYDAYRVPNFFLPALHDTQSSYFKEPRNRFALPFPAHLPSHPLSFSPCFQFSPLDVSVIQCNHVTRQIETTSNLNFYVLKRYNWGGHNCISF